MSDVNFHDAIGGQQIGVLSVQYDAGDPDITLATSLPGHIVADGPIVDLRIDGQEFKGTAFSVGNTVVAVTPDPQTADVTHVVGTPVYLILAKSTMDAFKNQPFVTDGDATADLPNSVDAATLPVAVHDNTKHTTTGTPGNSAVGDTAAQGSSASVARLDHTHGREAFAAPSAETVGASQSSGSAATVNHSDHVHAMPGAFGASGGSHAAGFVPDPGAVSGTTRYLREDATWQEPPGTGASSGHYEILVTGAAGPVLVTTADTTDYVYGLVG